MILVADNLQITNTSIEKAVKVLDPVPIHKLVIDCENAGANVIDINSGPLGRKAAAEMKFLIESVQEMTDLPVMIDTANPEAMEAGLAANKKTAIINGFSLEPKKLKLMLPLAKQYKSDIIGYLLYPDSNVPVDISERLNIAVQLVDEAKKAGVNEDQIIIDPIIAPIIWENGQKQAIQLLEILRLLPDLLGLKIRTIGGLSNLTTGKGPSHKKLLLERSYLAMLAASGLSMVLLNIFHKETVKTAKACMSFKETKIFSWEEL